MADQPTIIAPREPLVDSTGKITHAWFRALSGLFTNSGTLASPLVIQPSVFLSTGTVSSGGTISSPDLPAGTLIGNGDAAAGQATTIDINSSLLLSGGMLGVAPIPAGTLSGNSGSSAAPPGPIKVAGNLILSGGALIGTANTDDEALLYSISDTKGQIATLERQVNDALALALLARPGAGGASISAVNDAMALALLAQSGAGGGVSTSAVNVWTAAQRGAPLGLTDAATIAIDFSLANNFYVTLGGNRTLGNPTNIAAGQAGQIAVSQDATGSRTLAYGADWKFPNGAPPVLSTAASAVDILSYYVIDATKIAVSAGTNFS